MSKGKRFKGESWLAAGRRSDGERGGRPLGRLGEGVSGSGRREGRVYSEREVYYYYYYYTIWMSLVTGFFFPVLLLNQR